MLKEDHVVIFGNLVCTFISKKFNSLCGLPIFSVLIFLAFVCSFLIYRGHNLSLGDTSYLICLNIHALYSVGVIQV